MPDTHYLQTELETLIQADSSMWEFLQQGSLDGCWYWDLENPDQEWMSPEFWALFGIDSTTKRHDPGEWQDIIFPEDRDLALENFKRHLADPNHPYDQVVRYRHADGSTVWVRCRGIAIRDKDTGKPIRMLGAHNDLTATKQAERQLLVKKRAVEASNEELRTFCYAVSHDLKSPSNTLRLILSELEETQSERLDQEGSELLDMGVATLDRMQQLIEAVLRYTNVIEAQKTITAVDLNELVSEIIDDHKADAISSDTQIVVHRLPVVQGDRPLLRMLFANLISNAIKYRRTDVTPSIELSSPSLATDKQSRIDVRDNGIGIDEQYHKKIFSMFQRLHVDEDYPGAGLGLTMCRRIAHDHGGDIRLESAPDSGSTFSVFLERG